MKPQKNLRIFVGVVVAMIVAVVAVGLYLAGSPVAERDRQFDQERVNALQQIASAIDGYYLRNQTLPASLDDLAAKSGQDYSVGSITDPESGAPYEYQVTGSATYELCATFSVSSVPETSVGAPRAVAPYPTKPGYNLYDPAFWQHGPGRTCFSLNEEERAAPSACSITSPCQAGQNCVVLPGKKSAVCVPQGKECLAAQCASGKCVVSESYPAQISCTK